MASIKHNAAAKNLWIFACVRCLTRLHALFAWTKRKKCSKRNERKAKNAHQLWRRSMRKDSRAFCCVFLCGRSRHTDEFFSLLENEVNAVEEKTQNMQNTSYNMKWNIIILRLHPVSTHSILLLVFFCCVFICESHQPSKRTIFSLLCFCFVRSFGWS